MSEAQESRIMIRRAVWIDQLYHYTRGNRYVIATANALPAELRDVLTEVHAYLVELQERDYQAQPGRFRPSDRHDEALFRRLVPQVVANRRIIAVGPFVPGAEGQYASAYVITEDRERFATHRLICRDDCRGGIQVWCLLYGHYDLSLDAAQEDITARGGSWWGSTT